MPSNVIYNRSLKVAPAVSYEELNENFIDGAIITFPSGVISSPQLYARLSTQAIVIGSMHTRSAEEHPICTRMGDIESLEVKAFLE